MTDNHANTNQTTARFHVGQLVHHRLFDYRGVVIDVDPHFLGSETWYTAVAHSRPPKDNPWYHVLVDGGLHQTYVAERNLERETDPAPINHPEVARYFSELNGDAYAPRRRDH